MTLALIIAISILSFLVLASIVALIIYRLKRTPTQPHHQAAAVSVGYEAVGADQGPQLAADAAAMEAGLDGGGAPAADAAPHPLQALLSNLHRGGIGTVRNPELNGLEPPTTNGQWILGHWQTIFRAGGTKEAYRWMYFHHIQRFGTQKRPYDIVPMLQAYVLTCAIAIVQHPNQIAVGAPIAPLAVVLGTWGLTEEDITSFESIYQAVFCYMGYGGYDASLIQEKISAINWLFGKTQGSAPQTLFEPGPVIAMLDAQHPIWGDGHSMQGVLGEDRALDNFRCTLNQRDYELQQRHENAARVEVGVQQHQAVAAEEKELPLWEAINTELVLENVFIQDEDNWKLSVDESDPKKWHLRLFAKEKEWGFIFSNPETELGQKFLALQNTAKHLSIPNLRTLNGNFRSARHAINVIHPIWTKAHNAALQNDDKPRKGTKARTLVDRIHVGIQSPNYPCNGGGDGGGGGGYGL